ncbi:hypothetical protein [Halorubrum sp. CSM-61]|uniref:hypothetical protein n=1 Tax=Halorubrum sp. CSM-61 TaxID=2485838 RepID=UPI000F4C9E3E|nr:hypothetical protein [Halorubrum sp. CSM-61]
MSQRKQALERVWTFLWQTVVGWVILLVTMFIATIWAIIDIIWQFVSGRNDLSENSTAAVWVSRVLSWNTDQTIFVFTGGGDGGWRPLP